MSFRQISDPLNGERLVGVVPAPGSAEESGPHRLHVFSGRALSDVALRSEQDHRQQRLRQLARMRAAGVVSGLAVNEEQPTTGERWLHVGPGLGLSASGADVWLPRPLRLRFADLPRLDIPQGTPAIAPRREAQRLWILLLRPVSVLQADGADPNRCSEWDHSGRAFEEETRREGVLLGKVAVGDLLPQEGGGRLLGALEGHQAAVLAVSWRLDGSRLASGGADGVVRLWGTGDKSPSQPLAMIEAHAGAVHSLTWSPDHSRLASGGADGVLRLWKGESQGEALPIADIKAHPEGVRCLQWSSNGQLLASGGADGLLRLWRGEGESDSEPLMEIEAHSGGVHCLSWSPDGAWLASGGADGEVRLWRMARDWSGKDERLPGMAPVGKRPAEEDSRDGNDRLLATLTGHEGDVWSVSWAPSSRWLASAGADGDIRLWGDMREWTDKDTGSKVPVTVIPAQGGAVHSLCWSPDGTRLVSGGAEGDVQVWGGAATGWERVAVLAGHDGCVNSVSWDPNAQRLASGGEEATVRLWEVMPEHPKRWRNLVAHALLTLEQRAREAGDTPPWEASSVPIALLALTADRRQIAFVDSAVVVRPGGGPGESTPLLPGRGPASLVRARLRQFAEQMAELPISGASTPGDEEQWLRSEVVACFRHLPPFGLLPRAAMGELRLLQPSATSEALGTSLTTTLCRFFPFNWQVHLAPIPQEQLELALRDSAELAPYDLDQADQVQVWVPVPQAWFEPDLLLEESVNPLFQQKIDAFTALRNDLLYRRGWLRRRLAALTRAITGKAAAFAKPDPNRLDGGEPEENEAADAPDRDTDILRYVHRSTLLTAEIDSATPDVARKYMLAVKFGTQRVEKGLLFYTPSRGEIDLCKVDVSSGMITLAKKITDWRQTWRVIVPGRFGNSSNGKDDLFFYDPSRGEAEIYSIFEEESLELIATLTGVSQTWQLIVAGNFNSENPRTDLLFYDPSAGILEFFTVEIDGRLRSFSLRSFKRLTGTRQSWTLIIPGNFGGGTGLTDLLFYDQTTGEGEFCKLDGNGNLTVIKHYTGWRKTWNFILPGSFSNGNLTDLFFHDPVNREAEFYKLSPGGQLALLRKCWLPASPSSSFATGRFGVPPREDGVLIDDSIVTPEDDYGTFYIISGLPRAVAPLSLLTAQLLDASPIDTDSAVLLTKLINPTKKEDGRKKLANETVGSITTDLNNFFPQGKFTLTSGSALGTGLLKINGVMTNEEKNQLISILTNNKYSDYFIAAELEAAIDDLYERSKNNNSLLDLDPGNSAFTGLEAFVQKLELETAQTDDSIEFGFLQVRTNMYRLRQQVLGQEEMMKLATSPTLAAIASRESARASQDQLKSYFQRIKAERALPKSDKMDVTADSSSSDANSGITALPDLPTGAEEDVRSRAFPASSLLFQESNVSMASLSPTASFSRPIDRDVTLFQAGGFQFQDPAGNAPSDVLGQTPLIGRVVETISVADRLDQPAAIKVSDFAFHDQTSVLAGLGRQGLLKDLQIPGAEGLTFSKLEPGGVAIPSVTENSEAAFFSNAVRTMDLTVAALRLGEGRVEQYRQAIGRCQETLREIRRQRGLLEARLRVVDTALAEARQDVSVATALLAEERARVDRINDRRRRILRDQVPYLAFQRPRTLALRQAPPWLPLDPGPGAAALPPCLNDTSPIPREVRAMVDLLREAPLGWFNALRPELRRLDRIDTLVRVFQGAALRRGVIAPATPQPLSVNEEGMTPIGRSIDRLFSQRQQLLRQSWLGVSPQVPQAVASQSWRESQAQAERFLTLGDLLAGDHHRPELSNQAAALQERWCRVATCLKDRFGAIEPRLRLDWAERLSQFDGPVNLRVLTNLPRWGEVPDVRQRRALQSLVDWLFQQVNSAEEPALAFVNDLVRLSLLLACHAPVNQILSGQVIGTRSLAPEARLPIRMDPLRVRIGMPVLFHSASGVVAEGLVEDLSGDVATARILRGNASLSADGQTRVQFLRQPLL